MPSRAFARDSSGTILVLDEMAHADGKVIGRMIYSFAGDVGKAPHATRQLPASISHVVDFCVA